MDSADYKKQCKVIVYNWRVLMKKVVYALLTIIFFLVYWEALGFIWSLWVPFNPFTDILALSIVLIIIIPLSAISAYKVVKILKPERY